MMAGNTTRRIVAVLLLSMLILSLTGTVAVASVDSKYKSAVSRPEGLLDQILDCKSTCTGILTRDAAALNTKPPHISGDSNTIDEQHAYTSGKWPGKYDPPDFNARGNEVDIETLDIVHEGVTRLD